MGPYTTDVSSEGWMGGGLKLTNSDEGYEGGVKKLIAGEVGLGQKTLT